MLDRENPSPKPVPTRGSPPRRTRRAAALLGLLMGMAATSTRAQSPSFGQVGPDYLSRTGPYPPFPARELTRYNLKWGNLTARFSGSVQTEANDNINLSENAPRSDLSIGPTVGVGFVWRISKANEVHLDLDGGYRWYLNSPSLNSFNIAPKSILEHNLYFEKVRINLHDSYAIQVDPTTQGEISGGTNQVVNYRRFNNVSGASANWQPYRNLSLSSGFDYTYDRSLTSQFKELDYDGYSPHAGALYNLSPRWSVGMNGNYAWTRYVQHVQNNGQTVAGGPTIAYRPTQHITVNLSVGYSVSTFEHTGSIADSSSFRGVTYEIAVQHTLNTRTSQDLHFSRGTAQGIGSNFTDTMAAQYTLRKQVRKALTLHTSFAYQHLRGSGPGAETANLYLYDLGTNYQLSRRWTVGAAYTLAWKDSDLAGLGYRQNRLTLDFTRQF